MILIDIDPHAPHKDECNFWHGGVCDCHPAMIASAAVAQHCHECDYANAYNGSTPCNCNGRCICDREAGCPCVVSGLQPRVQEVTHDGQETA